MLRIEVDVFSGRPNPVWMITDEDATKRLLAEIAETPGVVAQPGAGFDGLGFREIRVIALADDEPLSRGLPRLFALASSAAENFRASVELAERLLREMPLDSQVTLLEHATTPLDAKLRDAVLERFHLHVRRPPLGVPPDRVRFPLKPIRTTVNDEKCANCQYEVSRFNPAFWNRPEVRPYNNCYNYGRNWRTDTFAQPGRAHGAQTHVMACNTVTAAAMADGLKKRCDCLPPSECPRRLMALVIDPGSDYHWYRHQQGGFWGHKPGRTAARNTDNSSAVITSPETCDRGGYTDFCGYFYAGRSVVIN